MSYNHDPVFDLNESPTAGKKTSRTEKIVGIVVAIVTVAAIAIALVLGGALN